MTMFLGIILDSTRRTTQFQGYSSIACIARHFYKGMVGNSVFPKIGIVSESKQGLERQGKFGGNSLSGNPCVVMSFVEHAS